MRRRALGHVVVGALVATPMKVPAQPARRTRRVGVLMTLGAEHPVAQARIARFLQGMAQAGWIVGTNLEVTIRWGASEPERSRQAAAELVALGVDVILATGSTSMSSLGQATRTIPIVFVIVPDPVDAGFVESLARPGGNATGFLQFEYALSTKWVELLKQIAPVMTRAGALYDPGLSASAGQLAAIHAAAARLGIEVTSIGANGAAEIESGLTAFAQLPNSGLIVSSSPATARHRELIINLAARLSLPAIYFERYLVTAGGLFSDGPDFLDQYGRAVSYVDRILKGEKPANLPVQAPTKYELVVNLRTARALGLTIPAHILAQADEVIE
ncbi:MAG: ABC transporter substrate-binding protein [Alphaproteobacteria bacterium]|nr:ABC transporter substrate-binding protein [Alphaproteobacteria bacterium]